MATAIATPVVSMEEYLHTSYDPDCDFVDGEVQERNLGEGWHSAVQTNLGVIFTNRRHEWGFRPYAEYRVRVSPSRIRIPDICLVPMTEPIFRVLEKAPALCVEVLSPEDRFRRTMEKVRDYLQMGVPAVWIINPRSRDIWTVDATGNPVLHEAEALTLAGTPVNIPVGEIFALIDEAPPGEDIDSK